MEFTHLNDQGRARMVDVTEKPVTHRTALAEATVRCAPATIAAIRSGGVKKGDVLFETLSGAFTHQTEDLTVVKAAADGVIASISLNRGDSINAGTAAAELYADAYMRIEASVTETDLQYFSVGDQVRIELIYLEDGEYTVMGTVEKISRIGSASGEDSEEASFTVYIVPAETEKLLYGMTALVSRVQAQ